jgi:hypothetical protein
MKITKKISKINFIAGSLALYVIFVSVWNITEIILKIHIGYYPWTFIEGTYFQWIRMETWFVISEVFYIGGCILIFFCWVNFVYKRNGW